MESKLREIFQDRSINVSAFAKKIGVPRTTIYSALSKKDPLGISVDVFIKIAHGLGMSADSLYDLVSKE